MSFSQTSTTNPLKIAKIARNSIDLVVNRDNRGIARSFVVNELALGRYKLPDDARVKLFAYSKTREQRIDLGTVQSSRLGVQHSFEIDTGGIFHFRLVVCQPNSPNIIAACEGLRPSSETDDAGRQPLLSVDVCNDLGERLWDVVLDGEAEPVLRVTDDPEIGMLAQLRGSPVYQALIIPQAVELVLFHLSQNRSDDGDNWQAKWNRYLSHRGIEFPEDDAEIVDCLTWARSEAQRFATEQKFLSRVRVGQTENAQDA